MAEQNKAAAESTGGATLTQGDVDKAVAEATDALRKEFEEKLDAAVKAAGSSSGGAATAGTPAPGAGQPTGPTKGYVLKAGASYHDANGDYGPGDTVQLTQERADQFIRDGVVEAPDGDDEPEETGGQTEAPKSRRRTS